MKILKKVATFHRIIVFDVIKIFLFRELGRCRFEVALRYVKLSLPQKTPTRYIISSDSTSKIFYLITLTYLTVYPCVIASKQPSISKIIKYIILATFSVWMTISEAQLLTAESRSRSQAYNTNLTLCVRGIFARDLSLSLVKLNRTTIIIFCF